MIIEGASVHTKCGGTGIIEFKEDGTVIVCPECMGSGTEGIDFNLEIREES
jgi:hypothetical protein